MDTNIYMDEPGPQVKQSGQGHFSDIQSEEEEGLSQEEVYAESQEQEQGDGDQPADTGHYATLHGEGPQTSAGSTNHPDQCMPCTFYCFTRRGCNRGADCRFCHLTHQSKLQQRREAWKKQQREKRKSIRERVAQEAVARRGGAKANVNAKDGGPTRGATAGGGQGGTPGGIPMVSKDSYSWPSQRPRDASSIGNADKNDRQRGMQDVAEAGFNGAQFAYNVNQATLTIGQYVELWPQLADMQAQFRLAAPLPQGMVLDQSSGIIHGSPAQSTPRMTAVVEAVTANGYAMRSTVDVEVVDFTRGGFVIGNMTELEPGKFMLLLYVPEGNEDVEDSGATKFLQFGDCNGQANTRMIPGCFPQTGSPGKTFRRDVQDGHRKDMMHAGFGGKEIMHHMAMEPLAAGGFPQRHL